MKAEIESRFRENLARVDNLVAVYRGAASAQGSVSVEAVDVLRAAVVFLHATLEDLLRSLLMWKLPLADAQHLKIVPLAGKKPRASFTLDDLAPFRGKTVDDLIARSVSVDLERSNFNDPGEVDLVLERIGLVTTQLDPYRDRLGPMMKRRHWIVHRADRNMASGVGLHALQPLQEQTVNRWRDDVYQFGRDVLASL